MPKCTDGNVEFGRVGRRLVEAAFDVGDIGSDGGVLLLKRVDERFGLTRAAALALGDERRSASVPHSPNSLLAQRIYGLCLGWSGVCDHNGLLKDLVMQTAVGRAEPLASARTLSRLETAATFEHAAALDEVLMQQFNSSHAKRPKKLVGGQAAGWPQADASSGHHRAVRVDLSATIVQAFRARRRTTAATAASPASSRRPPDGSGTAAT